uniref:Uncharacterized protein n=1 Tax=Ciona savignyi TaxID=51511 RepID=H2YGJ6_CIOSA
MSEGSATTHLHQKGYSHQDLQALNDYYADQAKMEFDAKIRQLVNRQGCRPDFQTLIEQLQVPRRSVSTEAYTNVFKDGIRLSSLDNSLTGRSDGRSTQSSPDPNELSSFSNGSYFSSSGSEPVSISELVNGLQGLRLSTNPDAFLSSSGIDVSQSGSDLIESSTPRQQIVGHVGPAIQPTLNPFTDQLLDVASLYGVSDKM